MNAALPPDQPRRPSPDEHVTALLDAGSAVPLRLSPGATAGHGASAAVGTVDGRPVCAWAWHAASGVEGLSAVVAEAAATAARAGTPLVAVLDGGPGPDSHAGRQHVGEHEAAAASAVTAALRETSRLAGVVPRLALVEGDLSGAPTLLAAATDVTVALSGACLAVCSPAAVELSTGEVLDAATLGGRDVAGRRAGLVHVGAGSWQDAYDVAADVLALLPSNALSRAPEVAAQEPEAPVDPPLDASSAAAPDAPGGFTPDLNARASLRDLLDAGSMLELQDGFGRAVVTALGRVAGAAVGVVASDPSWCAGALDVDACDKATRFVRFCDAFGLPVVTVAATPGFRPDAEQEWAGLARSAAALAHAYADAGVPLVTLTGHPGADAGGVLGGGTAGAHVVLPWPGTGRAGLVAALRALRGTSVPPRPRVHATFPL